MEFDEIYTEGIVESFIDKLKVAGVEVEEEKIHWRGFGSQGDGLSFDFKIEGLDVVNFLKKINSSCHEEISLLFENDFIFEIGIKTHKNFFANNYCHSNTRDIELIVEFSEELEYNEQIQNKIFTVEESIQTIQNEIKSWYVSECDNLYDEIYNAYLEFEEAENEEEVCGNQEDMASSDNINLLINLLIDPEMNIEKVVEMVADAKDLSYTKGESINLIEKFIKNFNDDYVIIKKVK